jgi:hypothetical protein
VPREVAAEEVNPVMLGRWTRAEGLCKCPCHVGGDLYMFSIQHSMSCVSLCSNEGLEDAALEEMNGSVDASTASSQERFPDPGLKALSYLIWGMSVCIYSCI